VYDLDIKFIEKNELAKFVNELNTKYNIYAPVKVDDIIDYRKITDASDIVPKFFNSVVPPKKVLFPQKEILFKFRYVNNKIQLNDVSPEINNTILLFIRNCDAQGIKILENFFGQTPHKDKFFLERRKKCVIIGLACNKPRSTCFCTSVGGSPFGEEFFDIIFIDLTDKFLIKGISEKGKKLLDSIGWLRDASLIDIQKIDELSEKAKASIKFNININEIKDILDNLYDDPLWSELGQVCIGCGTCAFLCPTCSCFDVIDERLTKTEGQRVRIWDTCQFSLFTLHGSGHNPRPTKKERTRQRIYHKFNYYPKNYDLIGCVGCGRCILYCPTNSDIRETLKEICKKSEIIKDIVV